MSEELQRVVDDLAEAHGLADREFLAIFARVRKAIEDEFVGSERDGGVGIGYADIGFEVNGVVYELRLSVRGASTRSKN